MVTGREFHIVEGQLLTGEGYGPEPWIHRESPSVEEMVHQLDLEGSP